MIAVSLAACPSFASRDRTQTGQPVASLELAELRDRRRSTGIRAGWRPERITPTDRPTSRSCGTRARSLKSTARQALGGFDHAEHVDCASGVSEVVEDDQVDYAPDRPVREREHIA